MVNQELNQHQQIIKKLFQEGKITTDELIILSSSSEESQTQHLLKSKSGVIEKIANDCIRNFPVDDVVNYMQQTGWRWALKEVNKEAFTNQIYELVEETVNQMFDYIKEHKESLKSIEDLKNIEESFGVATGGIEVIGFFDEDGQPEIEVKFIAANSFATYDRDEFRDIALID